MMLDLLKENVIIKLLQSSRLGVSALAIVALAGAFGPVSLPIAVVIGSVAAVYVAAKTAENINANKTSNGSVVNNYTSTNDGQ